MRRETNFIEGFDCRGVKRGVGTCDRPSLHGPNCGKSDRTDYGCHGDEWIFVIYDDENGYALDFRVFTDNYKGISGELARRGRALGIRHEEKPPNGAWLTLHRKYPANAREVLSKPEECQYVGLCYADSLECSASVGEKVIWKPFGSAKGGLNQSEEFWKAMEGVLRSWTKDLARADLELRKCSRCDGTGVERIPEGERKVDSRAKAVADEVTRG